MASRGNKPAGGEMREGGNIQRSTFNIQHRTPDPGAAGFFRFLGRWKLHVER
jgi:hypothetical protein